MATITAAGSGNWSNGATWNGGNVPGNGDTADLNGFDITMDIAVIPASGNLLGITSAGSAGTLVIGGVAGANVINAGTLTGGTKGTAGSFQYSGATCDSLTVNGNIVGCASGGTSPYGLVKTSTKPLTVNGDVTAGAVNASTGLHADITGAITINGSIIGAGGHGVAVYKATVTVNIPEGGYIGGSNTNNDRGGLFIYSNATGEVNGNDDSTGDVRGGTAARAHGVINYPSNTTINNCNFKNGTGGLAFDGYPPTWTPAADNWWDFGTFKFSKEVSAANLLESVKNGTVTGTYHEATVGEVQDGVMFGPSLLYEGEYVGGGGGVFPVIGGNHIIRRAA